jgi:hypothetical protein
MTDATAFRDIILSDRTQGATDLPDMHLVEMGGLVRRGRKAIDGLVDDGHDFLPSFGSN